MNLLSEPTGNAAAIARIEWDRLMWKHIDHHLRQFDA